jgi:hypothetical protein
MRIFRLTRNFNKNREILTNNNIKKIKIFSLYDFFKTEILS